MSLVLIMLRPLKQTDISKILVIENATHISPWSKETFNLCLKAGYLGWVVVEFNEIVGFVVISHIKDECHILNLAVTQAQQKKGYGRQLLRQALTHAKKGGANFVFLEVRRSNKRALSLYFKHNFKLIGERKGYYPTVNGFEDALVLAKDLQVDTACDTSNKT